MLQAAGSLIALAVLIAAGVLMTRRGLLSERSVDGLKTLITHLTLPLLLFRAFLRLEPNGSNALLALVVFAACALMGGTAVVLARAMRLPSPETRLLFQGFEAGMLGYAVFVALHTDDQLPAFAALDMGQVVYVFTVLLVQMSILEQHRTRGLRTVAFPWRDVAGSRVLWAIVGGLAVSVVAPGVAEGLAAPGGVAAAVFDTVGGLTTPLVCLVIGASLAGGVPRDPAIVTIVAMRMMVGLGIGLVIGLLIVPALGFSGWYTKAAIMLFALPAPFVIPVYHRQNAAFIGGVLTLSTVVSIVVIAVLAVVGVV